MYIFRGNRDFRACEAFRAAATAKEYVKATRGSMTESDFLYFKSQRKAMFEEWGIVGSKSRRELETWTEDFLVLEKLARMERRMKNQG